MEDKIRKTDPTYDITREYTKDILEESDSSSGGSNAFSNWGDSGDFENDFEFVERSLYLSDKSSHSKKQIEEIKTETKREFDKEEDKL